MANDARSEGLKFFATLGDLDVGDCVEGAEKAQCAALWHATGWYTDARTTDDCIVFATFAMKALRDDERVLEKIRAAGANLADARDAEPSAEAIRGFVTLLVTELATAKIPPPAMAELKRDKDANGSAGDGKGTGTGAGKGGAASAATAVAKPAFKQTEGLTVQPQAFIRELVGRKVNANDGTGAGADDPGSDSEAENAASEESKKRRVGKGKKRTAALLNETMSQMPQIAGTSMGVYCNYEGAEVIEVLAERQEKALLASLAFGRHLARPEQGKNNQFLTMLEEMKVPQQMVDEVRALFKTADGDKKERGYANAMVVVSSHTSPLFI